MKKIAEGWAFIPAQSPGQSTGLVLYPGAHIDPRAYAPLASQIAAHGFTVVVLDAPLGVPVLDPNQADRARKALPGVSTWAVGGHSLGGVAAATYVATHPEEASGLVLIASYPSPGTDLRSARGPGGPLRALSVYGSQDGLTTAGKIDASKPQLPADTEYVSILGGNHAQWGSYGAQQGDLPATISAADQQRIGGDTIAGFLGKL